VAHWAVLYTPAALATTAGSIFVATGTNAIAQRTPNANTVPTSQTTNNTSYVDLATTGPALTLTTGTTALVMIDCEISHGSTGVSSYMGYAVTGATSVSATDTTAVKSTNASGYPIAATRAILQSLTAGSNTFTAKYRVDSGTGTFVNRHINVIPF
jgi:hypothetical protein